MARRGLVLSVAGLLVAGTLSAVAFMSPGSAAPVTPTDQGAYIALAAPSRVLDTRVANGGTVVGPNGVLELDVTHLGNIPATASAVVLNVTATASTSNGFITVYAGGTSKPNASNLNYAKNETVPNLVVAPVGAGGIVDFANTSAGSVQLVADAAGYFIGGGTATVPGAYKALAAPSRLLDTRTGNGGTLVAANGTLHLDVTHLSNIPASASAVVLNVTVTAPTSDGFITVYGDGSTKPNASNLNYAKNETVPNLVVAPVGAGGIVDFTNTSNGTVQLVADAAGYFIGGGTPAVNGALSSLAAPSRLLDTRVANGGTVVAANGTLALDVTHLGNVPATASAVVLNVTVTAPASSGFITVYGAGSSEPNASNLNYAKNETVPNLVVAPVGAGGIVDLTNTSNGSVQLVADVAGFFIATPAPDTTPPGPVTNVSAAPTDSSIQLSWTNPSDSDFAGVMIRRATGATPPATISDGTLVVDTTGSTATAPDTGLNPSTQYSYSLFAHDGVPNYAAAATLTTATLANTTTDGTIIGTLTSAVGGHGVDAATVDVFPIGGGSAVATGETQSDGTYTVSNVPPGVNAYAVCFDTSESDGSDVTQGYVDICSNSVAWDGWENGGVPAGATPVTVTAGAVTEVDQAAQPAGAIGGTITEQGSGDTLQSAEVEIFTADNVFVHGASAATAGDGVYFTAPVPPSATGYYVCVEAAAVTGGVSTTGYVDQCYNGASWDGANTPTGGTLVPVTAQVTTTINIALPDGS